MALVAVTMSSCNIYRQYSRPEVKTDGAYRDLGHSADTTNMGNLPWEHVFTDAQLQALIRRGLENNADLQTARLRVKEAEAALLSSRLAYTPSLALAPQGTVSSFNKQNF